MKTIKNDVVTPIEISEKEFINQIKGCKKVILTNYNKEVIFSEVDEEGNTIEIVEIKGHFEVEIKKITKKPKNDDNSSILKEILKKLNIMDQRLVKVESRLDKIESRLDKVESRLDKIESRLDKVESRLDRIESRLDNLEKDVADIKRCPTVQRELSDLTH